MSDSLKGQGQAHDNDLESGGYQEEASGPFDIVRTQDQERFSGPAQKMESRGCPCFRVAIYISIGTCSYIWVGTPLLTMRVTYNKLRHPSG
ncbi:hypothetical protein LguiB_005852 [Lonicera macranthoides]